MSELRQDLVSGDWIILAPERFQRPHDFLPKKKKRVPSPKNKCPFEDLQKSGNVPIFLRYPTAGDWRIALIPNKFPALRHAQACAVLVSEGPYRVTQGLGHHDLVITRDHDKNFAVLKKEEAAELFRLLQARYRLLAADRCLTYTSSFFNWGPTAGASIFHPHYQVLTLPIIPPDVLHSLNGSQRYFRAHRRCVHCVMLQFELKHGGRIIAKNESAVAFAPFASRQPFEVRIFPRRHRPYFEHTPFAETRGIAELLQQVLKKIQKNLNDPDFNFFIHTAPLKGQREYSHYHWHIEILPKLTIPAGFELSTGVEISVIDPDKAAALLRRG